MVLEASIKAGPADAAEIKVIASTGMSTALREIAPQFERATSHKLILDFAVIAVLKERIAAGEAFDVIIVITELIDDLVKQGKIAADTPANIGRMGLGVIARKGSTQAGYQFG